MHEQLKIINYPDPRLKKSSADVARFDESLRSLSARMLELMRDAKGVGLAAPQVGMNIKLFVMNHSGEPGDDRVYVNPKLILLDGEEIAEEGCLSLPEIRIDVIRADQVHIEAQDVEGTAVSLDRDGFEARVWQHEFDHLLGILLTDRMSFTDKMKHRKRLKSLEAKAKK